MSIAANICTCDINANLFSCIYTNICFSVFAMTNEKTTGEQNIALFSSSPTYISRKQSIFEKKKKYAQTIAYYCLVIIVLHPLTEIVCFFFSIAITWSNRRWIREMNTMSIIIFTVIISPSQFQCVPRDLSGVTWNRDRILRRISSASDIYFVFLFFFRRMFHECGGRGGWVERLRHNPIQLGAFNYRYKHQSMHPQIYNTFNTHL